MTILKHELKQNRIAFYIWTIVISFMLGICIFIYPEMKGEMENINEMFSDMGNFTAAFGMDQINFGTLLGYYAVECGNTLGLGGALFAAICGVTMLAKEEKGRTAEFLLTHPVSRVKIITQKLLAAVCQVIALNVVVFAVVTLAMFAIGESAPWQEMILLHTAYLLLQLELVGVCFGVSAYMRGSSIGAGLGIALGMYFLNILSNIAEVAEFLKYITPFGYADGAKITSDMNLDIKLIVIGFVYAAVGIFMAYKKYTKKDIH